MGENKIEESLVKESIINGSIQLKQVSLPSSLKVYGSINYKHLTIEQDLYINGSAAGKYLKCQKLIVNGSLEGKNIEIKEGQVNGALSGNNITIREGLSVAGSLEATDINVGGKTKIEGSLLAKNSSFRDIEIGTSERHFDKLES